MNIVADVMRSTMHMVPDEEHHAHGAVAGTNGTVRSDSVRGHF